MNAMQSMEEAWGALVLAAVRAEGHGPTVWKQNSSGDVRPGRRRVANAGPATVGMMRLIAQGHHSTRELAEAMGISVDEASWRLRSLWKLGYIEKAGMTEANGTARPCMIYKATDTTAHWLSVYEEEGEE